MGELSVILVVTVAALSQLRLSSAQAFRCRPDQFRCGDSGTCIEAFRRCDFVSDCPGGEDEIDCYSRPSCGAGEFACTVGSCIDARRRCDGQPDCPDLSDEIDCKPIGPHLCPHGQFMCADGSCISIITRCDGNADCPADASDESGCPCEPNEWQCDFGSCIERRLRCNGIADCPHDDSDERNCPNGHCKDGEYTCRDGSCIEQNQRCNNHVDCPHDDSDELNCPCGEDQFTCENKFCIPESQRCDGINNCQDGSDEKNCQPCKYNEFQCRDRTCILASLRCNRQLDCYDGSDEENCQQPPSCRPDQFRCNDGVCLNINQRCNQIEECLNGEDEKGCPRCTSSQFQCRDGTCISISDRCNGQYDCNDGSDEEACGVVAPCPASDFTCSDGSCVPLAHKCDGNIDCPNGADEQDCGVRCGPDEFRCSDGKKCIEITYRCDTVSDCDDNSDEINCNIPGGVATCAANEFTCGDGTCIPSSLHCDGRSDCPDRTDEQDCGPAICRPDEFACSDGTCLEGYKECNGYPECKDGSDEADCGNGKCRSDQFRCNDGVCLAESFRCDGQEDCEDGSDEHDCSPRTCSSLQFTCQDGSCIDSSLACNRQYDCRDGSDEVNCPREVTPVSKCPAEEFECAADGQCIDAERRCDNLYDCRDFSDEQNCFGCSANEFQCGSGECVSESSRCNRRRDCQDGSDESGCQPSTGGFPTPPAGCPPGQVPCRTPGQCVPVSARCDGRYDCQDYSDESNCGNQDGGVNLKTYPEDQIIKENSADREVVFQCRDEGPLRIPVEWRRGNGLPLPPGSRDVNGRLEMPDIQVEHSGTYICQTKNYPRSPAAQASVHLTVEASGRIKITPLKSFHTSLYIPYEHSPLHKYGVLPYSEFDVYGPDTPLPTRPPTACGINEATCSNGECINKQYVCDDKYDCSDGSDEMRCNPHGCEPNEFRCANKKCVLKTWRCDADDDCGDNSDEMNCATNPPGSPCRYHEFACSSGRQCIPRAFQCDQEIDCQDGSDELGCSPVYIQTPPPPMVMANVGDVLTITCTAIGVPVPEVSWRLNWGHVPSKCSQTSVGGVGTLTCPDIQESDQGAYSCEAINSRGSVFAVPDSILVVKKAPSVCPPGYFNEEARSASECISCFCFGVTTECSSADLFTYQLPPPFDQYRLVGVHVSPSTGNVEVRSEPLFRSSQSTVRPIARNGFQVQSSERLPDNIYPYFALPENYHGNQLKSYGGYLKYTVKYDGVGRPVSAPDVVLTGNGYTLVHTGRPPVPGRDSDYSVRIFYGEWYKRGSARPGGDIPGEPSDSLATREEIMMALGDVDNILIRAQYSDGSSLDTSIFNINMDSAAIRNTGQGKAVYVEECRCPQGYTGLSCEMCAPGYNRHRSGPWLGLCSREREPCPPGQYGDPSRNIPCKVCPCPLTNPSNQFGRTCILDTDGDVTCECPQGYVGRRCEQCAAGYQGNPLLPGDSCSQGICDAAGSLSLQPDPSTGQCLCKDHATGPTCNQCKPDTFHLDASNQFGCINCFCMGLTTQCVSSSWYRQQVAVPAFTRGTHDFKLVEAHKPKEPITEGIRVDSESRELVFQDFSRRSPDVYYWLLPPQFLGDKVTSYGGFLNYTVRYVPTPGGQSSRNNAPDVELISLNDIRLLYFGREQIEPNRPQTIGVPLLEQHWQRHDGQTANREHLLMALADLEAILIKATYTTNTREAALLQVSLDVAEERNTGQSRALPVEQCQCPPGYRGLSCEDCAVGYTRADDGLYLGFCEPCQCNGHSQDCDPETGTCINCADHTTGDQCDECEPGYTGDATQGTRQDCQPTGAERCSCDPRGSVRPDCPDGVQCNCKRNVEGRNCDRCRPGTFSLSEKHIEGCLECFCSGVTDSCQQSNLYRTQIPMNVVDPRQKFTLTDSNRNEAVREGFNVNVARNEVGYTFPGGRSQRLFWSLPPDFTGNKITSYGGNLTVTQLYTARPGAERSYDTDVIIVGNGISLYWTNTDNIIPDRTLTYSVPLVESAWRRLAQTGPRMASRADLLTVLADVEAILIRASHSTQTLATYISDVSLDTAVPQYYNQGTATEVELCRCPEGYRGYSCESCDVGYYRDYNDRVSSTLGACVKCPCNGREESCSVGNDGRVTCKCRPGYTGRFCDSVGRLMMELEPLHVSVPVGTPVTFRCSYHSSEEMGIEFEEVPRLKPQRVTFRNGHQINHHHGLQKHDWGASSMYSLIMWDDLHLLRCTVRNMQGIVMGMLTAMIHNPNSDIGLPPPEATPPPRTPPPPPSISVTISEPAIRIVEAGSTVRYRCTGRSLITPLPLLLQWSKEGGELPRDRAIDDRQGLLVITDVRVSDSGTYICSATDGATIVTQRAVLTVAGSPSVPPQVTILPRFLEVTEGEPVEFRCEATGNPAPTLQWNIGENKQLNPEAVFSNGVFRIPAARKSDEAAYECRATNPAGTDLQRTILYVREGPPVVEPSAKLTVEPSEYSGPGGESVRLACLAGQERTYTMRWSRAGGRELPPNAVQRDGVLTIFNANPADSDIYVCTATSYTGQVDQVQARVTIISSRAPPTVRIEPEIQTISQGTMGELRCIAAGDPTPTIRWSKSGEELGSNIQTSGSLLRIINAMVRDRGIYICTAENPGGQAVASAQIEVERREPPSIQMYPESQQTVVTGGSVLLQCRVVGGIPSPRLRWRRIDGRPLSPLIEELPGGVLRFNQVTLAEAGRYECHAENDAGSVTADANIIVQSLPTISISPSTDVQTVVGQRVRLECRATGEPQPTVTWNKHRTGVAFYDTQPVTADMPQTAVYEITRVTKADEGSYTCVARNAAGAREERLHLTVEDNDIRYPEQPGRYPEQPGRYPEQPGRYPEQPGRYPEQPGRYPEEPGRYPEQPGRGDIPGTASENVVPPRGPPYVPYPNVTSPSSDDVFRIPVGGRAEMRCRVRGNQERIFLNWIRSDNALMPPDHQILEGTLYINNVQPADAGEYSCVGIGPSGTVRFVATARLVVIDPPRIQLNPDRQVVRPGNNAYISCTATGDQPMDIQWSGVGRSLPPSVTVNQGLLQFRGIAISDAGRYVCQARNPAGEAEAVAEVIVSENQWEPIRVSAVEHEVTASEGSRVELRCEVPQSGSGRRPYLTWTLDGAPLPSNAVVRGEVLELNNVRSSNEGRYICEARSGSDTASDHVYLRIDRVTNLALRIDPSQDEIHVGDTVDIRCTATGDTPVTFTWTKVGDRLASNAQVYGGLLRVQDVRPDNGGRYRCTARTPTSSFDEDYILAIQDEPDMNMNMNEMPTVETRTAPYGSTVVMDCRTDLEPPVTFSWSKQGGLLPRDANSREAVLSIPDVRAEDAGTYVCTAQNRKVKMDIPTVLVVTGVVPYFAQAPVSYMALPTLPDAYLQFGIEVAFKPESPNGLIVYNGQQKGGGGDFVSLGLNDSYVEFRFDVGSGPAIIRSARPIRTGEWHTVKVKRNRKEGTMYVDGEGPFTGQAAGRFQGLDLVEPLYVGGVPSFRDIHRLNGFNRGFVGCISRLVIGSVEHELVRDASISEGVTTCETCAVNPCLNQGICQEATQPQGYTCICPPGFSGINCDRVGEACFPGACGTGRCVNTEEGFECLCPLGKLGANCEHDVEISEPAFSDGAYVSYPTPRSLRKMRMAMKFNPANAEDGLLMYCAQADDGQGDFTSLAIRDKRLEFRFDSGSGAAVIRSERDISPGEWVTVNVSRHFREGELIVNNEPKVTGFSPGQTRGLNLRTPLYIGGFDKQRIRLAPGVEVNKGFTGCISQVEVSNMTLDIVKSVVDAANVQECGSFQGGALSSRSYSSSPCDRNPCLNGGTCRLIDPAQGQYDCSCQDGFRGEHCEIEENLCQALSPCHNGGTCIGTPHAYKCRCPTGYGGTNCEQGADFSSEVSFQGDGYVELSSSYLPHKGSLDEELIIVEFSTTEPNGLIFWHGQTPDIHGKGQDYLALAVVDGILEFSWELGSGPAQIQTAGDARVDDGKRHHVELRRKASDGSIELDKKTEFGESPGLLKTLNTKGNIYIGGLPDFEHMTAGKYKHGFVGCIHSLLIQDPSGIGINFREKALATVNAMACTNDYENDTDNDLWEFDGRVHK